MQWMIRLLSVNAFVAVASVAGAQEVDYLKEIQPILKQRCWSCHGALQQQVQLRLDTRQSMVKGGDTGPAIVPGHPEQSLLIERISSPDPAMRMPTEGAPLSAAQIDLIRRWIEQGATAPADELPEPDPREHWAFKAP
ncbi:c-type cytochrome domain-containing protein, partial [Schlesneria sp.]